MDDGKIMTENQGQAERLVNVDVLNPSSYLSYWCTCSLDKLAGSIVNFNPHNVYLYMKESVYESSNSSGLWLYLVYFSV